MLRAIYNGRNVAVQPCYVSLTVKGAQIGRYSSARMIKCAASGYQDGQCCTFANLAYSQARTYNLCSPDASSWGCDRGASSDYEPITACHQVVAIICARIVAVVRACGHQSASRGAARRIEIRGCSRSGPRQPVVRPSRRTGTTDNGSITVHSASCYGPSTYCPATCCP